MAAHREATELYRRAVDNMPADFDAAERGAILDEAANEAANVEDHEMAITLARAAADAHRAAGDPVAAINSTLLVINIDRRECGSTSERLAALRALERELEDLPASDAAKAARADVALYVGISETDRHDFAAARAAFALSRRLGDEVGEPEFAMTADWKEGVLDVIAGDVAGGVQRISEIAVAAERDGLESTGVSSYRDAALMAAIGDGLSRSAALAVTWRALCGLHRAVPLRARDALDIGADVLGGG